MSILFDLKHRIKSLWPILLGLLICLYFGYHAFTGERGVMRFFEVKRELNLAKEMEAKTAAEKDFWQKKVKLLSSTSLDLDRLDESSRELLNMGEPADRVVVEKGK